MISRVNSREIFISPRRNIMLDSRYNIATPHKPGYRMVVVGWDAPICSFFFQVWEEDDQKDEEPILWGGDEPREIPTIEQLQKRVAPYVEIPPEILEQIQRDYDQPWSPSPLQHQARKFFKEHGGRSGTQPDSPSST
jgi:hypothetical protein